MKIYINFVLFLKNNSPNHFADFNFNQVSNKNNENQKNVETKKESSADKNVKFYF